MKVLLLLLALAVISRRPHEYARAQVSSIPKRIRHGGNIKGTSERQGWGRRSAQNEPEMKLRNNHKRALTSMSLSFQTGDTPPPPPTAQPSHTIITTSPTSHELGTPTLTTSLPTTYWPTYSPTDISLKDAPASLFYFFAMGDVPDFKPSSSNSKRQNQLLYEIPNELTKLSNYDGKFLVHLGDIQSGNLDKETGLPQGPCPETMFQEIATAFEHSPLSTFFVPGDHAWIECENAEEAHEFWNEYLFRYNERHYPPLGTKVYRSRENPELFSFLLNNVLFIGQGLPGPTKMTTNTWRENVNGTEITRDWYMTANIRWMKRSVFRNKDKMKAIVIFSHAADTKPNLKFTAGLLDVAKKYNKIPILVMEEKAGLDVEENFLDQRNMVRMHLGNSVTPTAITVNVTEETVAEEVNMTDTFRFGIHH